MVGGRFWLKRDFTREIFFPFFSFVLPGYMEIFLGFSEVWGLMPAFSRYSVRIIPQVDVFLMYLWKEVRSMPSTPPSKSLEKKLWTIEWFYILIVVVAPLIYTCVKTLKLYTLKVSFYACQFKEINSMVKKS